MIKKILIANRGEIAIRVARACRELGIEVVGVYSEVDKDSLHLRFMDDAYCIGEPAPKKSYLDIQKIVDAAKKSGCEAIHPGYGFLAENAEFAKTCADNNIIFIGPDYKALALVGDKLASRNTARRVDVPVIPGMELKSSDLETFKKTANQVGYPVIIKASLGGGGKGMRVVHTEKELEPSISAGQREAKSAFGDDTVYLEKYIEKPRHIEFQVLRDNYGNTIHLFERECSIQRRHQKIIEETPSVALDNNLRRRMAEAAKQVISAAGYTNAGTVEFLLDENNNFYFLEVNARVQVEHPITELVTGVDLVHQQILIASGQKIKLNQEEIYQRGHAIEARIYAEDPENNFLPSPGEILYLNEPQGPGVRVDSGVYQGWNVPPHYDPILSKLIVWAEDREIAIARLVNNLKDYIILGIKTNIGFLKEILLTKNFLEGNYHTHFIDECKDELLKKKKNLHAALIAGALMQSQTKKVTGPEILHQDSEQTTPWQELGAWKICKR